MATYQFGGHLIDWLWLAWFVVLGFELMRSIRAQNKSISESIARFKKERGC